MKKSFLPVMEVITLDHDGDLIATSTKCFEAHFCQRCYSEAVVCQGVYNCTGFDCLPGYYDPDAYQ